MRKSPIFIFFILICFLFSNALLSQEISKENCIFLSSLHYTTKGMEHWYSKSAGGIETLTNIPYSELTCKNCHVSSCDVCHKTTADGRHLYSLETARDQDLCLKCHGREKAIMNIDKTKNQIDIHVANEMKCMDCHGSEEVHGNGTEYISMKQSGAMNTKCENCHESIEQTESHTVHKDKLECKSCHIRHVNSCTNCHFETLVNEGKRVATPVSGWLFLMNQNDKVTSANMQSFVVKNNKTFIMFAPHNSHSIMKNGRSCNECHASEIVKQVQNGKVTLTWLENGKVNNLKGVIPVVDGVKYEVVYQNYRSGQWFPIENPPSPLIHYVAFGKPLTKEQLNKLEKSVKIE